MFKLGAPADNAIRDGTQVTGTHKYQCADRVCMALLRDDRNCRHTVVLSFYGRLLASTCRGIKYKHTNTQAHKHANTQTRKHATHERTNNRNPNMRTQQHANVHTRTQGPTNRHKYTNKHANTHTNTNTNTLTHKRTNKHIQRHETKT